MTKPDWTHSSTGRMGGWVADIPPNAIRRYPHYPYRRLVTCNITTYVGYAIGARHVYATVDEEYNSWWDADAERWCTPWDSYKDTDSAGRRFESQFVDLRGKSAVDQAREWIRQIVTTHFPRKTHRFRYNCRSRNPKWLYREGD